MPNAADLTWATVSLDPASVAAVPTALATVPDAQARAVVWVALIDGVCLGTVDPRVLVRTFGEAWPAEDNDSVLTRTARVAAEPDHPDLPAAGRARVGRAGGGRLGRAGARRRAGRLDPCAGRGPHGGPLVGRRVAAAGLGGRPRTARPGWRSDSDFGWIAVRNLAARGLVDEDFVEGRRADDDTLQGRLNALMARAAMPAAEAKAWAWGELTANRSRSNYELNALAQGFWLADDLAVVRPYAERYFTDVPAMTAWVGEDAIARVATLAYPASGRRGRDRRSSAPPASAGGGLSVGGAPLDRRRRVRAARGAAVAGHLRLSSRAFAGRHVCAGQTVFAGDVVAADGAFARYRCLRRGCRDVT